jgi:carbon-monoxide dehydrogenase iron sulfur subunit
MRIKVDKKKCSGCQLCEMVCSLFHTGVINTEKSAIRIQRDDVKTSMNVPIVCRQCKEMKCLEGEQADTRHERKNFLWNKARAERCPFHAVNLFGEDAYHCDLCGGNPRCVKVCTPAALFL